MGNQIPRESAEGLGSRDYESADLYKLPCDDVGLIGRMRDAAEATRASGGAVRTVTVDGTPTALLGVARDADPTVANIWFHTVNGAERLANPLAFVRASRRFIDELLKFYDVLYNVIPCPDPSIERWMRSLGATTQTAPDGALLFIFRSGN
jgi:hypothetical protein